MPRELAARVAGLDAMFNALDIVDSPIALKRDLGDVARVHFGLAGELDFPWLRERIGILPAENHWQMLAKAALRDDLAGMLRALTAEALLAGDVASWKSRNAGSTSA